MNQKATGLSEYFIEVKFIGNFDGPIPADTQLVASDSDYVLAAKHIRNAVTAGSILHLWVRKRSHYSWLQNYCNLIDCHCNFGEMTPKLILSQLWQVSIPDWLTDQMVLENRLLDLKLPEIHSEHFIDAFLALILGANFSKPSLSEEDIPDLVSIAKQEKQQLFEDFKLLSRCLEEKCRIWLESSKQPWADDFCRLLIQKPKELWHDLSLYALLHGYPEKLLEYEVIPSRAVILRKMPVEKLINLKLDPVAIEKASNQIGIFFKDVEKEIQSSSDLKKLTGCCSGSLSREFQKIHKLLEKSSFSIDKDLIEILRTKFKACSGVSTSDLLNLDIFVIPIHPSPLLIGDIWNANKWVAWTSNEYIPYRHWQTMSGKADVELENTVNSFSDWYVENYVAVHQDQELSLAHVLTSWKDAIEKDSLSLILIIDCLPSTFFPLLQRAFHLCGFHKHAQGYRFAPLPSNTDVAKTLLLSGNWFPEKSEDYATTTVNRVTAEWPGKKPVYLSGVHALTEISYPAVESVFVLNYTPSDEVMHSDTQQKGMTHSEELFRCFEKLGESLHAFYQRWPASDKDKFSIYVVTDHGATRILADEKKTLESSVIKNLFTNEKHRFAYVDKEIANSVPENLWNLGYRFKQQFGTDERIYFIPRGHQTVASGKGNRGYTHGGASPEEIIVPVAIFKPVESKWLEPGARFVNLRIDPDSKRAIYHIQRMISVELTVQNSNPEHLQLLRVEIVEPEKSEIKEFQGQVVAANSESPVEVKCYFNKSALGLRDLQLRFTYRYGEDERELILSLEAEFKSAMTGGFSLRNL